MWRLGTSGNASLLHHDGFSQRRFRKLDAGTLGKKFQGVSLRVRAGENEQRRLLSLGVASDRKTSSIKLIWRACIFAARPLFKLSRIDVIFFFFFLEIYRDAMKYREFISSIDRN